MSAFDNGTSFIIYCKPHTLGAREQTYTLPQPAIHASISDYGTAILRETSLSVYPYQDSPTAPEFKREWKVVFLQHLYLLLVLLVTPALRLSPSQIER